MDIPRTEHPRPDFKREKWMNLNGSWNFSFDDEDKGTREKWFCKNRLENKILVPFAFQSEKSGIGQKGFHDIFWYQREIEVPREWTFNGRILLHIGAFDYHGILWINGAKASEHFGGYSPWTIDVTELFTRGKANIVIRGKDSQDKSQPRGKQSWEPESSGIMYTRVSGIWQTIWLEHVPFCYIKSVHVVPFLNPDGISLDFQLSGTLPKGKIIATVLEEGREIAKGEALPEQNKASIKIEIPKAKRWSPEEPFLYGLHFKVLSGTKLLDEVQSYTGIRTIERKGRELLLNEKPIRFKSVLDQGYFPGGIYTAETGEEIKKDVELIKKLGFNGARKHQKPEEPLYYYWCDRLGLLVWGEMGNAWEFTQESCEALEKQWKEVMRRDWNHPCIIAWVPLNESWGIPEVENATEQQEFMVKMARLTREMDPSRLVVDNSGWRHMDTDIIDLHPYTGDPEKMKQILEELVNTGDAKEHYKPKVWVGGAKDGGQPIVISEYGGIAIKPGEEKPENGSWGYGKNAQNPEELVKRFCELTKSILDNPSIAGYCYTQLTDVEQEQNGLLHFDRTPKAPFKDFASCQ